MMIITMVMTIVSSHDYYMVIPVIHSWYKLPMQSHHFAVSWQVLVTIPHILEMLLLSAEFQDAEQHDGWTVFGPRKTTHWC